MRYSKIGNVKMTKEVIELICELERIVGNQCYNPNSVNGYTWEEGCEFRYPVTYEKDGEEWRTTGLVDGINKKGVETMKYKFGSNHLYIGIAIARILDMLEEKYELDFAKLAKKHQ